MSPLQGEHSSRERLPFMITLRRTKAFRTLVRWNHLLRYPDYRTKDRADRAEFRRFCREDGGVGLGQDVSPRNRRPKTALLVRNVSLPYAGIESVVMKALQMAGFETVVLAKRDYDFLRYEWLAGSKTGFTLADFGTEEDPEWVERQLGHLKGSQDWLNLDYEGVHVGRIVLATTLRAFKVGQLDFSAPDVKAKLKAFLEFSVRNTRAAMRLLRAVKPDCVVFLDRGYGGQGEISDLALNQGIEVVTWNLGYKSNRLTFKRYNADNRRDHPLALSADSWQRLCAMPWKPQYGDQVREELFQCYKTQDFFSFVGTQFDKKILSKEKTREQLGLVPDKKVAVIFPHILWDGSFFFGEDLFENYTQWLIETIRAACANDRVQWIVKLHPAHLVKAKVENDRNQPAEVEAISGAVPMLPAHVKLVHPDTDLSTYSLFEIADYIVTVRGTVGIESALFGIPAVTAGTGRYDRRGFTLDSSSQQEYLQRLATLQDYPRLTPAQVELAERYAYGVFLCRPLALSSVSLAYDRDGLATPKLTVHCQTREQWLASPDMRQLAAWLADGKKEDMLLLPEDDHEAAPLGCANPL
jgi:hypothetical protein